MLTASHAADAAPAPTNIECGWLYPEGIDAPATGAISISGDGNTIVGYSWNEVKGRRTAFRWTKQDGMQLLEPDGPESVAMATNSDGSVVVGQRVNNGKRGAFRWDKDNGAQPLSFLPQGDENLEAFAKAVDGSGQLVVGIHHTAVVWDGSAYPKALPIPTDRRLTAAEGVNSTGDVVVGSGPGPGGAQQVIRWRKQGNGDWKSDELGSPEESASAEGRFVSASGDVIAGEYTASGHKSFRWTSTQGFRPLPLLDPNRPRAGVGGLSADGKIAVGYSSAEPVVWYEDNPPFSLMRYISEDAQPSPDAVASGVSADGTVVTGNATYRTGYLEPYRCTMRWQ